MPDQERAGERRAADLARPATCWQRARCAEVLRCGATVARPWALMLKRDRRCLSPTVRAIVEQFGQYGRAMAPDWHALVMEQLRFWWDTWFWPRVDGLTDEEYFWEPAASCWSVRPHPDGGFAIDSVYPAPQPPPVTTIAWRLAHIRTVFGVRTANHFGGPAWDIAGRGYPGSASDALAWVADGYARWVQGLRQVSEQRLAEPVGPTEGPWGRLPMAGLVLHINREAFHHGAEMCLLRDLWRANTEPR